MATIILNSQCVMIMIRQQVPITLTLEKVKQEDFHEFKVSLSYIVTVAQPGVLSRHRKTGRNKNKEEDNEE